MYGGSSSTVTVPRRSEPVESRRSFRLGTSPRKPSSSVYGREYRYNGTNGNHSRKTVASPTTAAPEAQGWSTTVDKKKTCGVDQPVHPSDFRVPYVLSFVWSGFPCRRRSITTHHNIFAVFLSGFSHERRLITTHGEIRTPRHARWLCFAFALMSPGKRALVLRRKGLLAGFDSTLL